MRLRHRRRRSYADYDAFLSYSRVDEALAMGLQRGLQRLMKPWSRVRSIKVFRDIPSLGPDARLERSIEQALGRSTWLVLLASPEAAASRWVNHEVEWWLEHRSAERLLIVVAAGEVTWDPDNADIGGSAIPPTLRGRVPEEPGWLDARWSRNASADDSRVHDAVAGLASTIKGLTKDEVFAADVREHRRTMRLARLAVATLGVLLVAAIVGGVVAHLQRNTAQTQATLALSRQLAKVATSEASTNLDVALVLAVEAVKRDRNPQSTSALMTTALASPHLVRYFVLPNRVTTFAGSADGRVVAAGLADGRVLRWEADESSPSEVADLAAAITEVAISADGEILVATDGSILSERSTAMLVTGQTKPRQLKVPAGQTASAVGISPSGRTVFVFGDAAISGAARSISAFDGRTGELDDVHDATDLPTLVQFVAPTDDEVVLLDAANGSWDRRAVHSWKTIDSGGVALGTRQAAGDPSADGEYMTATNGASTIPIWRLRGSPTNERPDRIAVAPIGGIGPLTLSADAKRLAVGDTGTIYVADTTEPGADPATPIVLEGQGSVDRVRFFGTGSRLLSSSGAKLVLWDVSQRDRLARTARVPIGTGCNACGTPRVTLSPDDAHAAVIDGSGWSAAVVDLATGRSQAMPDPELDFSWDTPLWSADGVATFPVVPPSGGSEAAAPAGLPALTRSWRAGEGSHAIMTSGRMSDGRTAAIVGEQGKVYVQRLADGVITHTISVHPDLEVGADVLTAAAVAPSGDRAATLLDDRISVTDLQTGRTLRRSAARGATQLAFGGGRLFVQQGDGTLEVRHEETLRVERTLPGDPSYVWPPVPSPDGTLVARQRRNRQIVLVDAGSGSTLTVLEPPAHSGPGRIGVAFSHDGRRLITVTEEASYGAGASLVDRDLSTATLIRIACRTVGAELSAQQWRRFVGIQAPQPPPCGR